MRTPTDRPLRVLIGIPATAALLATGWLLVGTLDFRSRWETASATESRVGGYEYDHFLSWGGEAMFLGIVALVLLAQMTLALMRDPSLSFRWALRQGFLTAIAGIALALASRLADYYYTFVVAVPYDSTTKVFAASGLSIVSRAGLIGGIAAFGTAIALWTLAIRLFLGRQIASSY